MKAEYLMLGQVYKPGRISPAGWFASEKLDGVRAYWDGGISRGQWADEVPYSNTVKDVNRMVATGLWSRTGKAICAPNYWLDQLPLIPLDGELFMGRKCFQETYSVMSRHVPDSRWEKIEYRIFDSPPYEIMMTPRTIKVRDYEFEVKLNTWRSDEPKAHWAFDMVQRWLSNRVGTEGQVSLIDQEQLPFDHFKAVARLDVLLGEFMEAGGEGVILRKGSSFYTCSRSPNLLKVKPHLDAEGTVVGYKAGEGKYEGMMGSLILKSDSGKIFKISGFTDHERMMDHNLEPGAEILGGSHPLFKIGSRVTYKYRELSDAGVPKEPRYWRKA